jgi:hypothetical protein
MQRVGHPVGLRPGDEVEAVDLDTIPQPAEVGNRRRRASAASVTSVASASRLLELAAASVGQTDEEIAAGVAGFSPKYKKHQHRSTPSSSFEPPQVTESPLDSTTVVSSDITAHVTLTTSTRAPSLADLAAEAAAQSTVVRAEGGTALLRRSGSVTGGMGADYSSSSIVGIVTSPQELVEVS